MMSPTPQYFLVRPDVKQQTRSGMVVSPGAMVPLIAVDQLPDWIDIDGVPRELEIKTVSGMINLGRGVKSDGMYDIRLHTETVLRMMAANENSSIVNDTKGTRVGVDSNDETKNQRDAPLDVQKRLEPRVPGQGTPVAHSRKISNNNERVPATQNNPYTSPHPPQSPTELMLQASRHATSNPASSLIDRRDQLPPHISPTLREGNKTMTLQQKNKDIEHSHTSYCRHWCHHGTCKWGLNCRYEHTMPTTLEGLQEVGLKSFPTWFITAMGWTLSGIGMGSKNFGMGSMGMSTAVSRMGMFGGGAAKKAKKMRDMMAAVPLSAAHGSPYSGAKTARLGQETAQGIKIMQVDGVKPGTTLPSSNGGNECDNTMNQLPENHVLPTLQPVHEAANSGRATGVVLGEGGNVATKSEEKLVDV